MCACVLSHFSRLTLCDPVGCSPPGSCVRGILQARILEWVACSSPGDLPNPGIEPASPATPALQAGSLPLSHRGSLGTVHDPPNNWDQQTGSSTNHTGCETPLRRGKGGQTRGAMQQGQRLPSAQKRVWLWDGLVWLGLVEVEVPLLYRNRGPLPGKSCPPVLLKDGRRGKTFLEILSPVRIRRVIPPYPKIN